MKLLLINKIELKKKRYWKIFEDRKHKLDKKPVVIETVKISHFGPFFRMGSIRSRAPEEKTRHF